MLSPEESAIDHPMLRQFDLSPFLVDALAKIIRVALFSRSVSHDGLVAVTASSLTAMTPRAAEVVEFADSAEIEAPLPISKPLRDPAQIPSCILVNSKLGSPPERSEAGNLTESTHAAHNDQDLSREAAPVEVDASRFVSARTCPENENASDTLLATPALLTHIPTGITEAFVPVRSYVLDETTANLFLTDRSRHLEPRTRIWNTRIDQPPSLNETPVDPKHTSTRYEETNTSMSSVAVAWKPMWDAGLGPSASVEPLRSPDSFEDRNRSAAQPNDATAFNSGLDASLDSIFKLLSELLKVNRSFLPNPRHMSRRNSSTLR